MIQRLFWNVIYKGRVFEFTDNSGVSDVIIFSDEPTISSGIGATAPFILKAGDLIVVRNIVGIIESAIINTADGEFNVTYSTTDTILEDWGVPQVGDEVFCIQANTSLTDYDNILSGGYYAQTDYSLSTLPEIYVRTNYQSEAEKAVYSEFGIVYNTKTKDYVSLIGVDRNYYKLYGLGVTNGSFAFGKDVVSSYCHVITDRDDVDTYAKRLSPEDNLSFVQENKGVRQQLYFRVIA